MNLYNYKAITMDGDKFSGSISANNISEAKNNIKNSGNIIISIDEVKNKTSNSSFSSLFRNKLKLDQISHFCRQFSIIISSGANSVLGLTNLAQKSQNKLMKNEMNRILEYIQRGGTISEAMLSNESRFPKLLGAMVSMGEATGRLDEVFDNMAKFYEREYKINQKIKSASLYPTIILLASFIMLFIFTSFILPVMIDSIMDTEATLPLITKIVVSFGEIMNKYWMLILILLILIIYQTSIYIKTKNGRYQKDLFINKIPGVGKAIVSIVEMRFSRALSLFISTGYPLLDGLDFIKDTLNNSIAEKAIEECREGIMIGESLAENLEKSDFFDSTLIQMVDTGEQTGRLEQIIIQMADFYEEEARVQLDRLVAMIEPAMIIFVGIMVTILVISVFLPMMSIYDAI